MLQIQRASAGSGKTFTLVKNFILHLIAIPSKGEKWKIRNKTQIEDAVTKILAITFTNKATEEMKIRIVEKLAQLSEASDPTKLSADKIKEINYLEDFATLTNEDYRKVGEAATTALKAILNNYSSFHISTIDSFFQEILRTFAYEVNLNDTYQLEIDSDYVSASALDATLNELGLRKKTEPYSSFWLKILIEDEAKVSRNWNVFNKSKSQQSIYSRIKSSISRLESEEFKTIRESLDEYCQADDSQKKILTFYRNLRNAGITERKEELNDIQLLRDKIIDLIEDNGFSEKEILKNAYNQIYSRIGELSLNYTPKISFSSFLQKGTIFKKGVSTSVSSEIDTLAMDLYSKLAEWIMPSHFTAYKAWLVYGELLPYFGLILEINKKLNEILANDNLVRLSDTNYILKKIVGDDDAPFIFERLGTRIENYLIDEFQDTSQMQWDVLKPLLAEAEAHNNYSLIIGDPKQSIYRFRNANHKLITEVVPATFPGHKAAGHNKEENTNWRSERNIVEFNNLFFKALSKELTTESIASGNSYDFTSLFSNVIQYPHKRGPKGFVSIKFVDPKNESIPDPALIGDGDEEDSSFDGLALSQLGPLVTDLIDRGYNQSDIGILVSKKNQGVKVIDYFIKYNETLPEGVQKIEFLSEDSLLLSSSKAVEIIITVLKKIADSGMIVQDSSETGLEETESEDKKRKEKRTYYSWDKIRLNYYYYSIQHPEQTESEKIVGFLKNADNDGSLDSLIENLRNPSLGALVEAISGTFLTSELRKSDVMYIAALQDAVNEYSRHFANDPASFLEWWESRGVRISISSPDNTDAVKIMTIHKSKGLEFKCVIIPFASDSFRPSNNKQEWRWVKPELEDFDGTLPPYLPVKTSSQLLGTPHEYIWRDYVDQIMTDELNKYYVAFTRAKNELYVFAKLPSKSGISINNYLKKICSEANQYAEEISGEEAHWIPDCSQLELSEDEGLITIGSPLTTDETSLAKEKENRNIKNDARIAEYYPVNSKRINLIYKAVASTDFAENETIN